MCWRARKFEYLIESQFCTVCSHLKWLETRSWLNWCRALSYFYKQLTAAGKMDLAAIFLAQGKIPYLYMTPNLSVHSLLCLRMKQKKYFFAARCIHSPVCTCSIIIFSHPTKGNFHGTTTDIALYPYVVHHRIFPPPIRYPQASLLLHIAVRQPRPK